MQHFINHPGARSTCCRSEQSTVFPRVCATPQNKAATRQPQSLHSSRTQSKQAQEVHTEQWVSPSMSRRCSCCRYKQTSSPLPLVCPHDGCADTNAKPNPHILNTDETLQMKPSYDSRKRDSSGHNREFNSLHGFFNGKRRHSPSN